MMGATQRKRVPFRATEATARGPQCFIINIRTRRARVVLAGAPANVRAACARVALAKSHTVLTSRTGEPGAKPSMFLHR